MNKLHSLKFLLLWAFMIILGTSCSVHETLTQNRYVSQTDVVLSGANYKIIGQVTGEASGKGAKRLVINNAYADMVKKADLTGSQALIYVNTERITKKGYGNVKVIVNATKIEFTK